MPTSQQIQTEIEQIEAAVQPINTELDRLYTEFGKVLPGEVEAWMKNHVKRRIEEHADNINAGGVEPLRQIKTDLAALSERLSEICSVAIGEQIEWPHRCQLPIKNEYESRSMESHAAASFRRAINHLGPLLAKHGLIAERQGYVAEWVITAGDKYRYAINPGFDERRFPALKEYQDKRNALSKQLELLEAKRRELAKTRARELWDEA